MNASLDLNMQPAQLSSCMAEVSPCPSVNKITVDKLELIVKHFTPSWKFYTYIRYAKAIYSTVLRTGKLHMHMDGWMDARILKTYISYSFKASAANMGVYGIGKSLTK